MPISIIKAANDNSAKQIIKNFNKLSKIGSNDSIIFRQFFKKYPLVKNIDQFVDGVFIIDETIYNLDRMDFIEDTSEIVFSYNHIQELNVDDDGNFEPVFFEIAILSFQSDTGNLNLMALVRRDGFIESYCKIEDDSTSSINRCLNISSGLHKRKSKTKRRGKR
jgi:hypothetical protein